MLYTVVTVAVICAWIPIFLRFLRAWRARHNPVSLAICATIAFTVYRSTMAVLVDMDLGSWLTARNLSLVFNALIVINFYAAFRWSETHFRDERSRTTEPPPNASKDLKD